MESIRLLAGLGNPGPGYERTRHNAGYWWVDAIVEARRARWAKETKFHGWVAKVNEGDYARGGKNPDRRGRHDSEGFGS